MTMHETLAIAKAALLGIGMWLAFLVLVATLFQLIHLSLGVIA